ncbi:MAG: pantoate--beta-alanine ligase [Planctomycetes bacterium]|nr:pantoate--beta-alanine ligase [Planctomycetota bacterium]
MVRVVHTIAELHKILSPLWRKGDPVGFVPTMGALHDGHVSLMKQAKADGNALVVASVFVNPLQFGSGEDYDEYPRDLNGDVKVARDAHADVVFAPSVAEMYPRGFLTYVDQDKLTDKLCGAHRPGHFRGVLTVVLKLFNVVRPAHAYFGQKDYQQAVVIQRMATDLNLDVKLHVMPIIREPDGLAMSSRNVYLGSKHRQEALVLHQALSRANELVAAGERNARKLAGEIRKIIGQSKSAKVDYISVVHPETLEDLNDISGKSVIAVAARFGKTRLIDNVIVE